MAIDIDNPSVDTPIDETDTPQPPVPAPESAPAPAPAPAQPETTPQTETSDSEEKEQKKNLFVRGANAFASFFGTAVLSALYLIRKMAMAIIFGPEYVRESQTEKSERFNQVNQKKIIEQIRKEEDPAPKKDSPTPDRESPASPQPVSDSPTPEQLETETPPQPLPNPEEPKQIDENSLGFKELVGAVQKNIEIKFGIQTDEKSFEETLKLVFEIEIGLKGKELDEFIEQARTQSDKPITGLDNGGKIALAEASIIKVLNGFDKLNDDTKKVTIHALAGYLAQQVTELDAMKVNYNLSEMLENIYKYAQQNEGLAENITKMLNIAMDKELVSEDCKGVFTEAIENFTKEHPIEEEREETSPTPEEPKKEPEAPPTPPPTPPQKVKLTINMAIEDANRLLQDTKTVHLFASYLGMEYDINGTDKNMKIRSISDPSHYVEIDKRKLLSGNAIDLARAMQTLQCSLENLKPNSLSNTAGVAYAVQAMAITTFIKQMHSNEFESVPQKLPNELGKCAVYVGNTIHATGKRTQDKPLILHIDNLEHPIFSINDNKVPDNIPQALSMETITQALQESGILIPNEEHIEALSNELNRANRATKGLNDKLDGRDVKSRDATNGMSTNYLKALPIHTDEMTPELTQEDKDTILKMLEGEQVEPKVEIGTAGPDIHSFTPKEEPDEEEIGG